MYLLNIKGADYWCIISRLKKIETINLRQNIDLTKKGRTLKNINFIITYKSD